MRHAPARFATSVIFLVHGLIVGAWVSRIPDLQRQLRLSEGVLGTVLLAIAAGSLVSMPLTGLLIVRFGSRVVTAWSTVAFCGALAAIPLAADAWSLGGMLLWFGAGAGAMDVAMNAQGASVQRALGRSILSSLHALFSIGGMVGALGGGQVARLGVPVGAHLSVTAVFCAVMALLVAPRMLGREEEPGRTAPGPSLAAPQGPVLALGALGFCMMLCEGAIADWAAIFLRDWKGAGPALAAAGYGVFSAAMAIGRLFGDSVTERFGPVATVRGGAALAAAGLAVAIPAGTAPAALAGFLLAGFGYAAIVPNVFAAAARIPGLSPGVGIAAVTTMGYFGFLAGPPGIGWLAEWLGLRNALSALVVLSVVGCALAPAVGRGPDIAQ